jgi:hypothetical protein
VSPDWAALFQRYADRVPCCEEVTIQIGEWMCVYDLTLSGISDARQRPIGRLFLPHHITYRRQIEDALQHREQILRAINSMAALLLESDAWTDRLNTALDTLGHVTHVSRVYLFENHRNETGQLLARQRAEWVVEGVTSQLDNRMLEEPSAVALFEQWIALLSDHQILHGLTRDFPADLQAYLAAPSVSGRPLKSTR